MKSLLIGSLLLLCALTGCTVTRRAQDPSVPPSSIPAPAVPVARAPDNCRLEMNTEPVLIRRYSSEPLSLNTRVHVTGCISHGPYEMSYRSEEGGGSIHQSAAGVSFTPPDATSDPTGHIQECKIAITATCPHGKTISGMMTVRIMGAEAEHVVMSASPSTPQHPAVPAASPLVVTYPEAGADIPHRYTRVLGRVAGGDPNSIRIVVVTQAGIAYPQNVPVSIDADGNLISGAYLGDDVNGIGETFLIYLEDNHGHRSSFVTVHRSA